MPAVWEQSHVRSSGRQLYRNNLMTGFVQVFQNHHNSISDDLQRDRSAGQVLPSHSAKSQDFFNAGGGIHSANVFPSPIIHINTFSQKSKTT